MTNFKPCSKIVLEELRGDVIAPQQKRVVETTEYVLRKQIKGTCIEERNQESKDPVAFQQPHQSEVVELKRPPTASTMRTMHTIKITNSFP